MNTLYLNAVQDVSTTFKYLRIEKKITESLKK